MNRAQVLERAKALTCGERNRQYGAPRDNMADIAAMWSAFLGREITPAQVAWCMVAVKMCRAKHSPSELDHCIDAAAYAAIAGECEDGE